MPRFEGAVGWSGELGYGVREPEPAQPLRDRAGLQKGVKVVER